MRVLIVDDDELFSEALQENLRAEGIETLRAGNGKEALSVLKAEKVDVVISDIRMPEMDGIELLKQLRSFSKIPVILMTGFSDIMETRSAHDLGASDFLAKPFNREDLLQAVRNCTKKAPPSTNAADQYCKLSITDFVSGKTIKFNIFIRLAESKFIKLAHKGEDISMDRIRMYREKGVHHLYMKREDFRQYVGFSVALTGAAQRSPLDHEKKLSLLRHTGEVINEHVRVDGVDEDAYESAEAFVSATIQMLCEEPDALELLASLRQSSDHILTHSVGVSMYSVLLAQTLEWSLPTNKIKVAMGGLFHDVGMKELNRDFLDRPRHSWNADEVKYFESHPLRGLAILGDLSGLPDDVREIVKQHHENCLAQGFPFRTKKTSIHPMAKLISVADEFCYRVLRGPHFTGMTPRQAVTDMMENYGHLFDRRFLEALAKMFGVPHRKSPVEVG